MNERKLYTIYKEKLIPIKKAVDTLFKMDLDEEDREILKKGISKMGQLFDKKKIEIVEEPYIIEFIMTVRGIVYKYKMRKNEGNKKNYDLFINVLGRELDEAMDRLGEPQVILKDAEISKFDDIYEFIDEMKESTKYRNGRIGGKVIKQLREYLGATLHQLSAYGVLEILHLVAVGGPV